MLRSRSFRRRHQRQRREERAGVRRAGNPGRGFFGRFYGLGFLASKIQAELLPEFDRRNPVWGKSNGHLMERIVKDRDFSVAAAKALEFRPPGSLQRFSARGIGIARLMHD